MRGNERGSPSGEANCARGSQGRTGTVRDAALVLRADGQVQRQRQGYHRPVVRLALTDALRRLLTGIARSASSARSGSIFALTAMPGKCSAISSATVTGLKQRGPWSDSNTGCARPPMRAESTTLASGMTAAGRDRVSARLYEAALRRRWRTWRKSWSTSSSLTPAALSPARI
jgi:hypothetical protein